MSGDESEKRAIRREILSGARKLAVATLKGEGRREDICCLSSEDLN